MRNFSKSGPREHKPPLNLNHLKSEAGREISAAATCLRALCPPGAGLPRSSPAPAASCQRFQTLMSAISALIL